MAMLEQIKTLLETEDTSKDPLINTQIELTKKQILNYCNIDTFPEALEPVVVDLIVNKALNDTRVSSRGSVSFSHNVSEKDLESYESQLSKFRQIRVV